MSSYNLVQAEEGDTVTTETGVYFWRPPSWANQWAKVYFTIDGVTYSCAEQFMMWSKARLFGDKVIAEKVMATQDPREHKRLGRLVKGFNSKIWDESCMDIVVKGNMAKFTQNPSFLEKLLGTGSRLLVEASPLDRIWGIGYNPKTAPNIPQEKWGKNLLGKCLMIVREKLMEKDT